MSERIKTIYAEERFYLACLKITNGDKDDADDLFQHTNLRILEKERDDNFKCDNLFSYYYVMAKRDYFSSRDKFARTHRERFNKIPLTTFKRSSQSETTSQGVFETYEPFYEEPEESQTVNALKFSDLDAFARTPSENESIKMIKDVYLEATKPDFEGITKLSERTGINKRTLYGALYRFRELFNDYINTL